MLRVARRGTGLAPLVPGAPASVRKPMSDTSQNSRGMRIVRFGMRQAALLLAVSALAMGGCGTLSGGLHSESMMGAPAPAPDPNNPPAPPLAPEQQPTGVAVEPHAGEQALAATVAFRPASFELIQPGSQPSYMVASVGTLGVARGPPLRPRGPPPDPVVPADGILEEYDPWESFNEKMFSFNYNL